MSLILARTKLGAELINGATDRGKLQIASLDIEALERMQPGQVRRRTELLGRLVGRVLAGAPIPQYRWMGVWACAKRIPLHRTLRAALGMMRRTLMRRQRS